MFVKRFFFAKKILLLTIGLIFIMVLSACNTGTASDEESSKTKVRVAHLKLGGHMTPYVAETQGFFEKHGLEVERVEFRDASKMIASIQSGEIDVMVSIPAAILTAREQGFDLSAFMQNEIASMTAPDSGAILVRKDSGIESLQDLTGKKIGMLAKGSQDVINGLYVIQKAGVDLDTLTLIAAPFPTHFDLLNSKQVDATFTVNPFTTQIMESGIGKVLSYHFVESVPGQPLGAWWAETVWIEENPEIIESFSLAIKDSIDFLQEDEKRAQQIVAEFTGLDIELVEKMPAILWNYNVDPEVWKAEIKILTEMGALSKEPNLDEFFAENIQQYFKN